MRSVVWAPGSRSWMLATSAASRSPTSSLARPSCGGSRSTPGDSGDGRQIDPGRPGRPGRNESTITAHPSPGQRRTGCGSLRRTSAYGVGRAPGRARRGARTAALGQCARRGPSHAMAFGVLGALPGNERDRPADVAHQFPRLLGPEGGRDGVTDDHRDRRPGRLGQEHDSAQVAAAGLPTLTRGVIARSRTPHSNGASRWRRDDLSPEEPM